MIPKLSPVTYLLFVPLLPDGVFRYWQLVVVEHNVAIVTSTIL